MVVLLNTFFIPHSTTKESWKLPLLGEREGAEWVVRGGWGQGGEMTQALYAHMNKKI
jgi:hypothetical protein